jgi:peptide/nickel transport system substrate-binding protein
MKPLDQLRMALRSGRISRREFLQAAAALGLAAPLATGLLGQPVRAEPQKGGLLRLGIAGGSTSDSLDPATYAEIYLLSLGFATHNTLTEILPDGQLVGDLAESWESSPDARVWTFRLRRGIEFHHGKTLDAGDVVASLNHHRGEDSSSAAKNILDLVEDIRADGPETVVITLHDGNADLPYLMVDYHLLIMPAEDGKADWQNYHGTGGYILDSFDPGVRATLKRNPGYWKPGRAHVDEVELLSITDVNARQNALTTGEVDAINRCDPKTVHLLARAAGIRIEEVTGYLHYTVPMICTQAPFDNNDVRLALKYGIDREALLNTVLRGRGTLGNDHPISPIMQYHAADLEQRLYDPDRARFHLKQAGLESLQVDLSAADAAFSGAVDAAVLYKEHAAPCGIDINVVREPNDGYWSNVWMKKPFSMAYWGGRPTADWMFSTAYSRDTNWNDSFWINERFNQLLLEARAELDESLRAEMYHEMQQLVRDDGGMLIWAFANYVMGLSERIQHEGRIAGNWELDGGRAIERWWLS